MSRFLSLCALVLVPLLASVSHAQDAPTAAHAQHAPKSAFLSHHFQLAPHTHDTPELSVHFGLIQPILFRGANVALDLRFKRFLVSYSHGAGLDLSATPSAGLDKRDRDAGLSLYTPWTTGGGVGLVLLDELYVLLDLKVHRFEASLDENRVKYTTMSVGGELGYRLFLWRGLFAQAALRYWPNVYSSLKGDKAQLGTHTHRAKDFGAFANVMLGWAFDV